MRKLYEDYIMKITPLTPIHIGSGEAIMPGEYFVFKEDGMNFLYAVDIGYLGSRLTEESRHKLCGMIVEAPVKWVIKVKESDKFCQLIRKYARYKAFVTDAVADGINKRWGKGTSELEVSTHQRSGLHLVVPGSSIKGALRTALLYSRVRKPLRVDNQILKAVSNWERKVLGSKSVAIQDDLLRHLKVSDALVDGVETRILDVEHVGMRDNKSGKQAEITDYRECLPGVLEEGIAEYTFNAAVQISSGHPHYFQNRGKLSKEDIIKACREFYSAVINAELDYWKGDSKIEKLYADIQARFKDYQDVAPIRLGWGCGMDSVSLNLAKPTGRHPRGKTDVHFLYNPRTRRIFDGLYPPGWAVFTLESV